MVEIPSSGKMRNTLREKNITERLIMRQWKDEDVIPYAQLNADVNVMRYFPTTLSKQQSDAQREFFRQHITEHGWGFWAVELKETGQFIGFVGLLGNDESSGLPNTPHIEIGWRLSSEFWGFGYATEAAQKALEFAFETLLATSIYSFTALQNEPSRRVMQKIGMENTNQDFKHPKLPAGHSLERHCLYKITKEQWYESNKNS